MAKKEEIKEETKVETVTEPKKEETPAPKKEEQMVLIPETPPKTELKKDEKVHLAKEDVEVIVKNTLAELNKTVVPPAEPKKEEDKQLDLGFISELGKGW